MMIKPTILTGRTVSLVPLSIAHVPDLTAAGQNRAIWTYMRYGEVDTEERMLAFVSHLLDQQAAGTDLPFAVTHLPSQGLAIGTTRYMNIEPANRSLEIGGTWYGVDYQRTVVNTEAKYLLLRHAFETLGCIRVQFKADLRNERSQRAIERIGAVREGVLRDHVILPDGTIRCSVIFSIIKSEWPTVKQRLMEKLGYSDI